MPNPPIVLRLEPDDLAALDEMRPPASRQDFLRDLIRSRARLWEKSTHGEGPYQTDKPKAGPKPRVRFAAGSGSRHSPTCGCATCRPNKGAK